MNDTIFIAIISLHYEERPTQIVAWNRCRFAKELLNRKYNLDWHNYYFKRVTHSASVKIQEETERNEFNKRYDLAIQEKYGVPAGFKHNRWFMEQVRPSLT